MGRRGTKPCLLAVVSPEVEQMLDKVSKAALIDLFVNQLALTLGNCDTPPTPEDVSEYANAVLRVRGDRLLKP